MINIKSMHSTARIIKMILNFLGIKSTLAQMMEQAITWSIVNSSEI